MIRSMKVIGYLGPEYLKKRKINAYNTREIRKQVVIKLIDYISLDYEIIFIDEAGIDQGPRNKK